MSSKDAPGVRLATNRAGALRPVVVMPGRLGDLLDGPAEVPAAAAAILVGDLCLDSRTAEPGDLFVALSGVHAHGASFAAEAVAQGAVAVLTDAVGGDLVGPVGVPVVVCADPRAAMAAAAARLFGEPTSGLAMFGVTGTNGKTTTTCLVAAGLEACGVRTGVVGTLGFRVGPTTLASSRTTVTTPEAHDLQGLFAVMAANGAAAVTMEVTSHALVLERAAGVRFDVAGFTNLGRDHLDYHGTMEAYFEAKARLFTPEMTTTAVLNADDAAGQQLIRRLREAGEVPVVTYGYDPVDDYRLMEWRPDGGGCRFTVRRGGRDLEVRLALPGEYNARNAVLALAMIEAGGFDGAVAAEGLRCATVPGRMEPVPLGPDAPYAYVDFGHTPQAVAAALGAVPAPRVAVVGAGGDRDPAKRGPMGAAAAEAADLVVVTDDNPRTEDPAAIRAAIRAGAEPVAARLGHRVVEVAPREAALAFALEAAAPGESVVVLGKGHETTQLLADGPHPFSDAAVLREAWQRLQRAGG